MSILDGIVKGLTGILPEDDPDVKILNAQTELKELVAKEEKTFSRFGRRVYETDGGENYPEIKAELDRLAVGRREAEERLQAARDEKVALERAATEERVRRENEEQARSCPDCGNINPEGTNFCSECGTKLAAPAPPATKRFCSNCGNEIAAGYRFCSACGTKTD